MSRVATYVSGILVTMLGGCSAASPAAPIGVPDAKASDQASVIVELFTSQGCSSCPRADRLLAELKQWASDQRAPLLCLSFHVDYWNNLGWEDPYSSRQNSNRQRDYAAALGDTRVYTPQMIVNGRQAFVGSQRDQAIAAIKGDVVTVLPLTIKLSASAEPQQPTVKVLYEVTAGDSIPADTLNIALVETSAHNSVPRGENAGIESVHVNVVRVFQTVALRDSAKGQVDLQLPSQLAAKDCEVIAYVQNEKFQVQGATHFSLADRPSNRVSLSDAEWQKRLTPEQFNVTRQAGTERPFTGKLLNQKGNGAFTCICCGAPLFDSTTKFESGTGWPSFWKPSKDGNVEDKADSSLGITRTEVLCQRCGAHLGHVFNDGPKPTGLRYCINSVALSFIETDKTVANHANDATSK